MISGVILAVIIEGLSTGTELTPLNIVIEHRIIQMRTPALTTIVVGITRLGDPFVLSFATVLIAALLVMRGRSYDAMVFAVALMISIILLMTLKNAFQITRPGSDILDFGGWSFPSGHATVATAFFFMFAYSLFNRMRTLAGRAALILGSILATTLICFSRLYLGAHWTLDILAGITLGFLSVSFTVLFFDIFIEKRRSLRARINF